MLKKSMQSLVSVEWLAANKGRCIPVDASWHMPTTKRNAIDEFTRARIPGSRFFDIDRVSDHDTTLPHMLPSTFDFSNAMQQLNIKKDDHVILYDQSDVYSAFRVYWTLKVFGHDKVSVLDGGMVKWALEKREIERGPLKSFESVDYGNVKLNSDLVTTLSQIREDIQNPSNIQIVDARSNGRFDGTMPEPRAGLKSGHMPNSLNLPFTELVNAETHTLKSLKELREAFKKAKIDVSKPIVCTCGSGVTASVVYFCAELLGCRQLSLYDGSWSEYAADSQSDIITKSN